VSLVLEYLHYAVSGGNITFAPAPPIGHENSSLDLVKGRLNFRMN
jgi:hypothetical protein